MIYALTLGVLNAGLLVLRFEFSLAFICKIQMYCLNFLQ